MGPARKRVDSYGIHTNAQPRRRRRPVWALEGMTGIEPAPSVWKTEALPLSYIPAAAGRGIHDSMACPARVRDTPRDVGDGADRRSIRCRSSDDDVILRPPDAAHAIGTAPTGPSARLLGADQHVYACAPARGVAQLGRAPALGAGGRRFKSCRPDITAPKNPHLQLPRWRAVDYKENEQAWSTAPSRSSPRPG